MQKISVEGLRQENRRVPDRLGKGFQSRVERRKGRRKRVGVGPIRWTTRRVDCAECVYEGRKQVRYGHRIGPEVRIDRLSSVRIVLAKTQLARRREQRHQFETTGCGQAGSPAIKVLSFAGRCAAHPSSDSAPYTKASAVVTVRTSLGVGS